MAKHTHGPAGSCDCEPKIPHNLLLRDGDDDGGDDDGEGSDDEGDGDDGASGDGDYNDFHSLLTTSHFLTGRGGRGDGKGKGRRERLITYTP